MTQASGHEFKDPKDAYHCLKIKSLYTLLNLCLYKSMRFRVTVYVVYNLLLLTDSVCIFSGISQSKVTVLGYGLLTNDARSLVDTLKNQRFGVVIVDESHYLKSRNAARTKILVPVIQNAKRAILLTGTPALGRPEEVTARVGSAISIKNTLIHKVQFAHTHHTLELIFPFCDHLALHVYDSDSPESSLTLESVQVSLLIASCQVLVIS